MRADSAKHYYPSREVCIIGCGVVTAVGYNALMNASSVRANSSRFQESYMVDRFGEPMLLSMVKFIGDEVRDLDRLVALAVPAMMEAMHPVLKNDSLRSALSEIGICLGIAALRPGLHDNIGQSLLSRLTIETAIPFSERKRFLISTGHASTLSGIEKAVEWIASGKEELVLIGGVDSYYNADTLEWLDENKRLHSEQNKDGFIPGEGAGFCLLASSDFVSRYRLMPLATILSAVSGEEPHPLTSNGICIGQGLTHVLSQALAVLTSENVVADWTLCDMNGESFPE